MIGKELIGKESESVVIKIRSEEVHRFTEALGIPFSHLVPPTYVGILSQASIPGFEAPLPGMIHGEQKITYLRPLYVGDCLTSKRRIKDVYERKGKLGSVTIMVIETSGYDLAGELIFTSSSTLIAPAKVESE
ncbi:MAG TPA: MaoC family dehydratase N-terminal domain-containing protein [Desulfosporosinus sp.]|nr:MaoC family dehydratase N-terminal domain-containing protein [Desulfosporosinus sp.]